MKVSWSVSESRWKVYYRFISRVCWEIEDKEKAEIEDIRER